jgi:hypothetical protein
MSRSKKSKQMSGFLAETIGANVSRLRLWEQGVFSNGFDMLRGGV